MWHFPSQTALETCERHDCPVTTLFSGGDDDDDDDVFRSVEVQEVSAEPAGVVWTTWSISDLKYKKTFISTLRVNYNSDLLPKFHN